MKIISNLVLTFIFSFFLFISYFIFTPVQNAYAQTCYSDLAGNNPISCPTSRPPYLTSGRCYYVPSPTAPVAEEMACPSATPPNDNNSGTGVECTAGEPNCCVGDNGVGVRVSVDVGCVESDNPILSYLGGIINFLSVGVGVVVVAMVVTGGVQYITSRGVPQQIEAAKKRITNALIALIMFIFMYAFLQWLIPGGLFG